MQQRAVQWSQPTSAPSSTPVFLSHPEWHLPHLLWLLVPAFSCRSGIPLISDLIALVFYLEEIYQNVWFTVKPLSCVLIN